MAGAKTSRPAGVQRNLRTRYTFFTTFPLVHCMTNDVVQTFTANTVALGASPAMVIETEEESVCGYRQCVAD